MVSSAHINAHRLPTPTPSESRYRPSLRACLPPYRIGSGFATQRQRRRPRVRGRPVPGLRRCLSPSCTRGLPRSINQLSPGTIRGGDSWAAHCGRLFVLPRSARGPSPSSSRSPGSHRTPVRGIRWRVGAREAALLSLFRFTWERGHQGGPIGQGDSTPIEKAAGPPSNQGVPQAADGGGRIPPRPPAATRLQVVEFWLM